MGIRFSIRPSFCQSTFMSTFDIYVKVSILINYKTKQSSNLAWNISLTSWFCDIGVRFSIRLSVHLPTFMSKFDIYVKVSILINYKTKQASNLAWNISLTSWLCDIGGRFSMRLSVRLSVNSSVMSKFDVYDKVSILINYKTKQPSNLAWNISLTSWLCDIGARFSIRLSVRLSVNSFVMSKFDIYVKVSILINYNSTTTIIPCMTHFLTSWLGRYIDIVLLNVLTRQIPWPGDLDLYFGCSDFDIIYFNIPDLLKCKTLATKPCIVLLLDVLTRHVSWPGDLDLYFAL